MILIEITPSVVANLCFGREALYETAEILINLHISIEGTLMILIIRRIGSLSVGVHGCVGSIAAPDSVSNLNGESVGRNTMYHIPQRIIHTARHTRVGLLGEYTVNVGVKNGLVGQIDVQIGPHRTTRIFVLRVIGGVSGLGVGDVSLGGHQVDVGVITELLSTTLKCEVEAIHVCNVTECLIHPVDIGEIERIGVAAIGLEDCFTVRSCATLVAISLIDCAGVCSSIHKLRFVG